MKLKTISWKMHKCFVELREPELVIVTSDPVT